MSIAMPSAINPPPIDRTAKAFTSARRLESPACMSVGGGLMALGIAMLIWEMSVRYGVRR